MSYHQPLGQLFNNALSLPGGTTTFTPTTRRKHTTAVHTGPRASSDVTRLQSEITALQNSLAVYQKRLDAITKRYKDGFAAMVRRKAELTAQFRYVSDHGSERERNRVAAQLSAHRKLMSSYSMEGIKKAAAISGSMKKIHAQITIKEQMLALAVTHDRDVAQRADVQRQADELRRQKDERDRLQAKTDRDAQDLQDRQDAFQSQQDQQAQDRLDQQTAFQDRQDAFQSQQDQQAQDRLDQQTAFEHQKSQSAQEIQALKASSGKKNTLLIALGIGVVVVGGFAVMRGSK